MTKIGKKIFRDYVTSVPGQNVDTPTHSPPPSVYTHRCETSQGRTVAEGRQRSTSPSPGS